MAHDWLVVVVGARHRRDVGRRRHEIDHAVEHALHALVLEGRTTEHRLDLGRDGARADAGLDFHLGQVTRLEVLVHQLFRRLGRSLEHVLAPLLGLFEQLGGDLAVVELHALRGLVPDDHLHLVDDLEEVGAGAVHLVDEGQARHLVLIGLAPDRLGLRLHTAHGAIHHAGTVEHAHRALDFNREVDVPGGVDDVDAVLGEAQLHALPEAGGGCRGDGDAALLLLLHPVHRGGAVMHFADLVVHTCVEQDALGRRRLAGIDVRGNADVAVALDGGLAGHGVTPNTGAALGSVITRVGRPERLEGEGLEAEVRERLVGFGHAVHFIALLHGAAAAFAGLQEPFVRAGGHRLLAALAGRLLQPAHGQGHPAHGANFHGNLVVRTADAAGLDFDHRLDVVDGDHEDLQRVLAGLLFDLLKRTVDDALGDGLLARFHDDVHELGQIDRTELRIGQDLALGYFATTWHFTLPFASVGSSLRSCLGRHRHLGPPTYSAESAESLTGLETGPAVGAERLKS